MGGGNASKKRKQRASKEDEPIIIKIDVDLIIIGATFKQGSSKRSNIKQAKCKRMGAGKIISRRREALLRGSPLGGRWVAGLMIEGEAKPPIKRGFALSSIGKPAGWAGGLREEQEDGCVEDNF